MKTYIRKIVTFISDEEGASASEYVLLVSLIAIAILLAVGTFGNSVSGLFKNSTDKISAALP